MTQIKVIILAGGKTCREVNKLGSKPVQKSCQTFMSDACNYRFPYCIDQWQAAEDSLRTFEIEKNNCDSCLSQGCPLCGYEDTRLIVGKEYTADILENNKARIV